MLFDGKHPYGLEEDNGDFKSSKRKNKITAAFGKSFTKKGGRKISKVRQILDRQKGF